MSRTKPSPDLITLCRAARLAHVMTWKVRELARRRIIYATRWGRDYLLSPVVVEQLPRLCSEYFTDRGEYLENPPTYAEYTASEIGGIVQIKERIIE